MADENAILRKLTEMQAEAAASRAETAAGFAELRAEVHAGLADVRAEIGEVRNEMRDGFAAVRGEAERAASENLAALVELRGTITDQGYRLTRVEVAVARLGVGRASEVEAEAERGLRLDAFDARLSRIERRLELRD